MNIIINALNVYAYDKDNAIIAITEQSSVGQLNFQATTGTSFAWRGELVDKNEREKQTSQRTKAKQKTASRTWAYPHAQKADGPSGPAKVVTPSSLPFPHHAPSRVAAEAGASSSARSLDYPASAPGDKSFPTLPGPLLPFSSSFPSPLLLFPPPSPSPVPSARMIQTRNQDHSKGTQFPLAYFVAPIPFLLFQPTHGNLDEKNWCRHLFFSFQLLLLDRHTDRRCEMWKTTASFSPLILGTHGASSRECELQGCHRRRTYFNLNFVPPKAKHHNQTRTYSPLVFSMPNAVNL